MKKLSAVFDEDDEKCSKLSQAFQVPVLTLTELPLYTINF
ncbi:hypothetical protein K737_301164 [Holospora undulata HU1]|uniref:Uncharacterized protein n=1 Tax=Holospora undulata HU1 TaxID=1321371 RepID=A0A061JGW0_9PROT|nr:hypothetical protein K737_301164 [Holospora undulata HU1]